MKKRAVNWPEAIQPLLDKYEHAPHPLHAKNLYQFMVMVVLAAQTTDAIVNQAAPGLFKAVPDMKALSAATPESLIPLLTKVRNFRNKAKWLTAIGRELKTDDRIPRSMAALTHLPGIGRKSANVLLRQAGLPPEGIVVDVHVLRVAPRLGIASGEDATKIEKELMAVLPPRQWDAGMAMSFLGREICRPAPECSRCLMNAVCAFYHSNPPVRPRGGKPKKST